MSRRAHLGAVAALVVSGLVWFWYTGRSPQERAIRERLDELAEAFNSGSPDSAAGIVRAARIGQFFTDDVVVELGQGSPPIRGRETLIGMAARLQPRTAAFELELEDVSVELAHPRADVTATLLIRRRGFESGEESLDARELAVELRDEGAWRISRVVAIDTLR